MFNISENEIENKKQVQEINANFNNNTDKLLTKGKKTFNKIKENTKNTKKVVNIRDQYRVMDNIGLQKERGTFKNNDFTGNKNKIIQPKKNKYSHKTGASRKYDTNSTKRAKGWERLAASPAGIRNRVVSIKGIYKKHVVDDDAFKLIDIQEIAGIVDNCWLVVYP